MAAILARAGLEVTVLEAQVYPGGCASTYLHKGYRFESGATLAGGFYPGGPMEMMSLFHLDGKDKLVHTHYCALQNQPTMLFVKTDEPNRMRFEFAHGMSLDVNKDLHTHHTEFRLLEDGNVEVHIDTWQNGKTNNIVTFTVQRKTDK